MSDDQIIEAKSKEIKRLHRVCQAKDQAIKKAVDFLDSFSLLISGEELEKQRENLIVELTQTLG